MADRRKSRRRRIARAAQPQEAPRPARRQKATGWRLPLIFCAVILIVTAAVWGYRKISAPAPLPIAPELLEIAGKSHLNLDGDEEGRRFKEELISAGRGFSPNWAKDDKVLAVAQDALDQGRIDVVCTAVQVVRDGEKRDKLLKELAQACLKDCKELPWAVFAVRNLIHDYPVAMDLTRTLNARWEECRKDPAWLSARQAAQAPAAQAPAQAPVQTPAQTPDQAATGRTDAAAADQKPAAAQ